MLDKLRGGKTPQDLAATLAERGETEAANDVLEMADGAEEMTSAIRTIIEAKIDALPDGDERALSKFYASMAETFSNLYGENVVKYCKLRGIDEVNAMVLAIQSVNANTRKHFRAKEAVPTSAEVAAMVADILKPKKEGGK